MKTLSLDGQRILDTDDGLSYEVATSLMLRDKFWFPATQARSMAEQLATRAADLADLLPYQKPMSDSVKAIASAILGEEQPKVFAGFQAVMQAFNER